MTDALYHRGPDDEGYHVADNIALGMRRLSIIDLKTGHQPIFSNDGSLCIVLNGELYNYKDLRNKIKHKYRFQTNSDTEVILAYYQLMGMDCLEKFNGMFAFLIWDKDKKQLMAARDRMGVKPLYVYSQGENLVVASEIKSMTALPWVSREIDYIALQQFLVFEYIPAPRSIYKNINKLSAGHYFTFRGDTPNNNRYWRIPLHSPVNYNFSSTCRTFRNIFRDAVKLRLVSDVPVGLLLSGGIDSSTIAAEMRSLVPDDTLHSFSIGFEDSAYDESGYARMVASRFNFIHHHETLREDTIDGMLPEIYGFLDEPLADASIIPTYCVSKLAKQYVKVVLSGDGGDEGFLGYDTYKAHMIAHYLRPALKPWVLRFLTKLLTGLPHSDQHMGYQFKLLKFLKGVEYPHEISNTLWWGAYDLDELRRLLEIEVDPEKIFEPVYRCLSDLPFNDILSKMSYLDFNLYLQDDLLTKVDRMSMANSVEVRNPFLDYRLVNFAINTPSKWKLHPIHFTSKYLIKKAFQSVLPDVILNKPKRGFDIPLTRMLRDVLKGKMNRHLSTEQINRTNIFKLKEIERIKDRHCNRVEDNRQLIWALMVFHIWFDNYAA